MSLMDAAALDKLLENIASEKLLVSTLAIQGSDRLDFHEVAVWQIRSALEAAYEAGRNAQHNATSEAAPRMSEAKARSTR